MKKYIFALCAILSIGQCYSMQDAQAHKAIVDLYGIIKSTKIKMAPDNLFMIWNRTITNITQYAIENSKNALNQPDIDLIMIATSIQHINNKIITLYRSLKLDIQSKTLKKSSKEIEKNAYKKNITELKQQLDKENKKLTASHLSIPKQKAQSILRETAKYLTFILDLIENKIDDIPIELH